MSADEPTAFVDMQGLTLHCESFVEDDAYLDALVGLPDDVELVGPDQRYELLASLREGAGVTVYTGPFGAAFWLLASVEVKVRVVPDGTDMTERVTDVREWSFRAAGGTKTQTKKLLDRKGPPKRGAAGYDLWVAAEEAVSLLLAVGTPRVRVLTAAPVEIIYDYADQYRFLGAVQAGTSRTSEDWEWDPDRENRPLGLAISDATQNWYLPVAASDYHYNEAHTNALRRVWAERLREGPPVVMHNARSDLGTQYPYDPLHLSGRPIDDTLVMAYNAGENLLKLKELTRSRLSRDPLDYPEGLADLPVALAARYAGAGDTRNTYDLYFNLLASLQQQEQTTVYEEIERPLVPIIASMEKYGSPIDGPAVELMRDNYRATEEALHSLIWQRFRRDISSKDEIRALVLDQTGFDPGSVAKDTLSKVPDLWMDTVLGYRRVRHRRQSFAEKHLARWEAAGRPDEFRGFTYFNQAGNPDPDDPRSFRRAPRSGRLSSSGEFGNFQNQPLDLREIFVAPEGHVFWSLDYTAVETMTAAAASQDPAMLAVLREGGDMHDNLVEFVYEVTGDRITRLMAKRGNFSAQNGGGAAAIVKMLAGERMPVTYATAEVIANSHRALYSGYHDWCRAVIERAKANGGYSETLWGRKRYEPDVLSPDRRLAGNAGRSLHTHIVQGSAADLLKLAMGWAVPTLLKYNAHLSMQVHDELCGWVPKEAAREFLAAMTAIMESIELPGLKLKVSGGAGENWAEVH